MENIRLSKTQTQNLNFLKVFLAGLALLLAVQLSSSFMGGQQTRDYEKSTCTIEKAAGKVRKS
ncbi:MAG: hypothetical protein MUE85_06880 [Microscillaceae bacterium]|jgi:hypothetical protein|nr:hypothetical protein [Microscillaceae bacterium]